MEFIDLPDPIKKIAVLWTDRGTWIRVGTFVLGWGMIVAAILIMFKGPVTKVAGQAVGVVTKGKL